MPLLVVDFQSLVSIFFDHFGGVHRVSYIEKSFRGYCLYDSRCEFVCHFLLIWKLHDPTNNHYGLEYVVVSRQLRFEYLLQAHVLDDVFQVKRLGFRPVGEYRAAPQPPGLKLMFYYDLKMTSVQGAVYLSTRRITFLVNAIVGRFA